MQTTNILFNFTVIREVATSNITGCSSLRINWDMMNSKAQHFTFSDELNPYLDILLPKLTERRLLISGLGLCAAVTIK